MNNDKQRIRAAFTRHYGQYEQTAVVQRDIALRLDAALAQTAPGLSVQRALEIGIGTGFLTRLLTVRYPRAQWWFNDLSPAALDWIPAGLLSGTPLPGDAEQVPYPARLDLIASSSVLQWFRDVPGFLGKVATVLRPGGVLAITTFAEKNLEELRELSGSVLTCPTTAQLRDMAESAGLRVLRVQTWQQTLYFPDAAGILRHLRSTGVNGASTAAIRTPSQLQKFQSSYAQRYATASGLPLTYHPLLLIAEKHAHDCSND